MLTCEVSLFAAQAGDRDGILAFQRPDHGRHRVLGPNRDAHVHMVRHQVAFDDLALFLPSQRVEDRTQVLTRSAEGGFPPSPGYEHYVVLAVPF